MVPGTKSTTLKVRYPLVTGGGAKRTTHVILLNSFAVKTRCSRVHFESELAGGGGTLDFGRRKGAVIGGEKRKGVSLGGRKEVCGFVTKTGALQFTVAGKIGPTEGVARSLDLLRKL